MLNLPYVRVPPTSGRLRESGAAARAGSRPAVWIARPRLFRRAALVTLYVPPGIAVDPRIYTLFVEERHLTVNLNSQIGQSTLTAVSGSLVVEQQRFDIAFR